MLYAPCGGSCEQEKPMSEDVYKKLSKHLSSLGMGYPEKEELLEILRENFTPREAEVALAIPTKTIPFEPESHAVFPFEMMEELIRKVNTIAVVWSFPQKRESRLAPVKTGD